VMGYVDTLLALLIICTLYFAFKTFKHENKIHTALAGIFLGLSLLTKISTPFLGIFFILLWLIFKKEGNLKILLTIFIIAGIIMLPMVIRSFVLFGDICYGGILHGAGCGVDIDTTIDTLGIEFIGRTQQVGTEVSLFDFGLLNYVIFAYGFTVATIFLFGLGHAILRKKDLDKKLILLLLTSLILFFFSTARAEDTARYMIPMLIPMTMIGGIFISQIYEKINNFNAIVAAIFIIIFVFSVWVYGQEKLDAMVKVKQFIPGFFDGCDWIDKNTPEDSILFTAYDHRVGYGCNRRTAGNAPDKALMFLVYDDRSYDHMKDHGIDYVFIIEGLISPYELSENYPVKFIEYVDTSDKFSMIYDNRNIYGKAGIRIYEVL